MARTSLLAAHLRDPAVHLMAAFASAARRSVANVNRRCVCAMGVVVYARGHGRRSRVAERVAVAAAPAFMCTVVTTGLVLTRSSRSRRRAVEAAQRLLRELREQTLPRTRPSLYNPRFLQDYLDGSLSAPKRERAPLALIMMDPDRFSGSTTAPATRQATRLLGSGALLKRHVRAATSDRLPIRRRGVSRWCSPDDARERTPQDRGDLLRHQARVGRLLARPLRSGSPVSRPCDGRGGLLRAADLGPLRSQESGTQPGQDFRRPNAARENG